MGGGRGAPGQSKPQAVFAASRLRPVESKRMEASRPGIPATQPAGPGKARGAQATSHGPLGTDQPLKAEAEAATLSVLFPPGSGDVSSEVASPGICEKRTFPGPPQLKGSNLGVGSAPPPPPPEASGYRAWEPMGF